MPLAPAESHGLEMPCFKLHRLQKESWRRAVATWHKLKEQDSKKELLRACFGCIYARRVDGEFLACPLLEGLAVESQRLQARLCEQSTDLSKCMQESGKPRLEASVLAYLLFEMENEKLRQFVELLPRRRFAMVAPVFDAVVAALDPDGDAETLVEDFETLTEIRMQVAQVCTETASATSLQHRLNGREVSERGTRHSWPVCLRPLLPWPTYFLVLDAARGRHRLLVRLLLFEDATVSWGFCMFPGRQRLLAHTLLFEDAIGSCRTFL